MTRHVDPILRDRAFALFASNNGAVRPTMRVLGTTLSKTQTLKRKWVAAIEAGEIPRPPPDVQHPTKAARFGVHRLPKTSATDKLAQAAEEDLALLEELAVAQLDERDFNFTAEMLRKISAAYGAVLRTAGLRALISAMRSDCIKTKLQAVAAAERIMVSCQALAHGAPKDLSDRAGGEHTDATDLSDDDLLARLSGGRDAAVA